MSAPGEALPAVWRAGARRSAARAHLNTTMHSAAEGTQGMSHQGMCQPSGSCSLGQQTWNESVDRPQASTNLHSAQGGPRA